MNPVTVLIAAQDMVLARRLMERWQQGQAAQYEAAPAFVMANSGDAFASGEYTLAILIATDAAALQDLAALEAPVLCLLPEDLVSDELRRRHPLVVWLALDARSLEAAVIVGRELLHRVRLEQRGRVLEQSLAAAHRPAELGHYMLDTRHDFNNALTSVLGNAELLMLDPEALPSPVREQVATIHTHALQLHSLMRRLTRLDAELKHAQPRASLQAARNTAG